MIELESEEFSPEGMVPAGRLATQVVSQPHGKTSFSLTNPAEAPSTATMFKRGYNAVKRGRNAVDVYSKLHDRCVFDDRRAGTPELVCMLAGYKPDLWPFVMPRFRTALPESDVCLVSPGMRSDALAEMCRAAGWSYLSTVTNDVSLAQNVCYRLHDRAELIVKLDEDMFLLPTTISALLSEYHAIKREGVVDPGFVAPIIPLNGFCYRTLLEMLGLLSEYEANFGVARIATTGVPVQCSPAAALWIWEKTSPLAATAARLAAKKIERLLCPIQLSIGLIVFERCFWEAMNYFPVYRRKLMAGLSTLGGDEAHICASATQMARPAIVTTASIAGHFSFGPQYSRMRDLLEARPEIFLE